MYTFIVILYKKNCMQTKRTSYAVFPFNLKDIKQLLHRVVFYLEHVSMI